MGNLATYLFHTKPTLSGSRVGATIRKELVQFLNISMSGPTRVITQTASAIADFNASGGYQPAVHEEKMEPYTVFDPGAILKAIILPSFTNVPYGYEIS